MKNSDPRKKVKASGWPEVCVQPQCVLRDDDFDAELAAQSILRLLSGEDVSDTFPPERRITRFDRCRRCVSSVLKGGLPIPTDEEFASAVTAGRRSQLRQRRSRRSR
jgi:hypothetical protein